MIDKKAYLKDRKSGMNRKQATKKYGISYNRLQQIDTMEELKALREKVKRYEELAKQ